MTYDQYTLTILLEKLSELFLLPNLLGYFVAGIVFAFFGYKLFKTFLRATYAIGAGAFVYGVLMGIPEFSLDAMLPNVFGLGWTAIVVLVVAILAAILAPYIYKFVSGMFVGAFIGVFVAALLNVQNAVLMLVIVGILAVVFGLIFVKIFKAMYILGTSLGGGILAGFSVGAMLFPATFNYLFAYGMQQYFTMLGVPSADIAMAFELANLSTVAPQDNLGMLVMGGLIVIGLIVGIIATVVQFKKSED